MSDFLRYTTSGKVRACVEFHRDNLCYVLVYPNGGQLKVSEEDIEGVFGPGAWLRGPTPEMVEYVDLLMAVRKAYP